MEFLNSIQNIKSNWGPYKKWEKDQEDKDFQRKELYDKVPVSQDELEHASQYGRTLIDSINLMDQYSINKAEDVELATEAAQTLVMEGVGILGGGLGGGLGFVATKSPKMNKIFKNCSPGLTIYFASIVGTVLSTIIAMPFIAVKSKTYQKEASRVARYQAREEELKDPKNFVIYNKEQIEKAKEIAKNMPDIPEKKKNSLNPITNWSQSIQSIKSLINNHKQYANWKAEHTIEQEKKYENLKSRELSSEQIETAKKDQDNLLRIIRKIETYSQNYLNNVEMATNVVMGSSAVAGFVGGLIVSSVTSLLGKMKVISPDSAISAFLKNKAKTVGTIFMPLVAGIYAIQLQKEAAKIGRFKAKQELLSDPHNFINYNDEQYDSVKDLKAPKGRNSILDKLKNDFMFFFQIRKDAKAYEEYQKIQGKEEQKLDKALLDNIEVSDKQMHDAKSLQKNAFTSFEKMDEMAQRYTDDMEAATEIGKQVVAQIASLAAGGYIVKQASSETFTNGNLKKIWGPVIALDSLVILLEFVSNKLKLQSGRIGVMEAMQDLQDPKLFVNED